MVNNILLLVIVSLLVEIAYLTKSHKDQLKDLLKAVIAKNLHELNTSTIIESEKSKPIKEVEPEFVPIEQVDDKKFNELIKQHGN
jgi:hypothetical protein